MASSSIVLVFLLMLFLPCAMTLLSERRGDAENARADAECELEPGKRDGRPRLIPSVLLSHETETKQALVIKPRTPAVQAQDLRTVAAKPTYIHEQTDVPVMRRREVVRWHETTAPVAATQTQYARIESPAWTDDEQLLAVRRQQRHDEDWREREEAKASGPRMRQTRLEMAELDVLRARAVALRAHAESLAVIARVARAKAEAAVEEAVEAEHEARHMGYYLRRAA